MYVRFKKEELKIILPEVRPAMIFIKPDLFVTFEGGGRFVICDEILDKLNNKWLHGINLWESRFDFGVDASDYDKQFSDYKTLELLQFPKLDTLDTDEVFAFVYDLNGGLYINERFVSDLKSAGCVDVWYDTTAPFGRY